MTVHHGVNQYIRERRLACERRAFRAKTADKSALFSSTGLILKNFSSENGRLSAIFRTACNRFRDAARRRKDVQAVSDVDASPVLSPGLDTTGAHVIWRELRARGGVACCRAAILP
jgi:hypothetical protein